MPREFPQWSIAPVLTYVEYYVGPFRSTRRTLVTPAPLFCEHRSLIQIEYHLLSNVPLVLLRQIG